MKAFILAAGKGTRLRPFTDSHPKALAKVNGIPLLEWNILYLQSFGIQDFVINVHHFGDQIISFLKEKNNFGSTIAISNEKDELLETGGGLLFAEPLLKDEEDFIIMNADILTTLDITKFIDFHLKNKNFVTLAVSDRESSRKLLFDEAMSLRGWKNISTGEEKLVDGDKLYISLAFSGIHCVSAQIFKKIKRRGKFSIMEEYLDWMQEEEIKGFQHQPLLIDVGRPSSVLEAEKYFK